MAPSEVALKLLTDSIDDLKRTIQDAQKSGVAKPTLANVVELATLRTHSLLETFLQEVFYLALLSDPSVPGSGPTLAVRTREEADLLLLSSGARKEKFLSWLPLERTLDMAETYLREGSVFERVRYRHVEKRAMHELLIVRNAIAHPSDDAHAQFRDLARGKSYPSSRPSEYLLSTRGGAQEVLLLMTQAEVLARGLLAPTDADAAVILEAESDFGASQKAPVGKYVCARCGAEAELTGYGKLGACSQCEPLTPCPHCSRIPAAQSRWRRVLSTS